MAAISLAAMFTLATFILLPSLETMRHSRDERLELRRVDTVALEPPPPPVVEPPPPPEQEVRREMPKPELEQRPREIPLSSILDLGFGGGALGGDFALDFAVADFEGEALDFSIFEWGEIDQNPTLRIESVPPYPVRARARRITGAVVLEFVVDSDGSVRDISVVESEPEGVFEQTVLSTVRRWRFNPGIKDGRPVAVRVQQKFKFELD